MVPSSNNAAHDKSNEYSAQQGSAMNLQSVNRRTWIYLISAAVLLIGLISAILIYQEALHAADNDSGYEILGGKIYPGVGNSKKYVHDLRIYGGEAAVVADQITRWFAGLWEGTQLAYTIGWTAFFISLGFFVAARSLPPK
jgi:hypothetical protein